MNFLKKRSTAWVVFAVTVVISFFIGMARKPSDTLHALDYYEYVQDNADVITAADEKYITQINNNLQNQVYVEIQVATIDTTNGRDIMDMAYELAEEEYLGGYCCVLLIAKDDGDATIVPGIFLTDKQFSYSGVVFSDEVLNAILYDNFIGVNFDSEKQMSKAIRGTFDDIVDLYESYFDITVYPDDAVYYYTEPSNGFSSAVGAIIITVIIALILLYVICTPRWSIFGGTYHPFRPWWVGPAIETRAYRYEPYYYYDTNSTNNYSRTGNYSYNYNNGYNTNTRGSSRTGDFSNGSRKWGATYSNSGSDNYSSGKKGSWFSNSGSDSYSSGKKGGFFSSSSSYSSNSSSSYSSRSSSSRSSSSSSRSSSSSHSSSRSSGSSRSSSSSSRSGGFRK